MRVLFLSGWFPYPPDNGAKIRIYSLLKGLARAHEVTLISFASQPVVRQQMEHMNTICRDVRVVATDASRPPSPWRAWLGHVSPLPSSVIADHSGAMDAAVRDAARAHRFDLAVASGLRMVPYVRHLKTTPCVLEELELGALHGQVAMAEGGMAGLRRRLMWVKTAHYVRRLLRRFEACTVVSEPERELLARVAPAYEPVHIVPNGVDIDAANGSWGEPVPNTIVHAGALSYSANRDAVRFFLEEVLPRITPRVPDVAVRMTGEVDGSLLRDLPTSPNVEYTGYLDDVRPTIARSWLSIVPLRQGGGTRLKILESMALGTPVVSTSKGAEGLEVVPGEHLLVADSAEEFADSVLSLLGDPTLRSRIAAGARDLVMTRYSWAASQRLLEETLARVALNGGATC